MKITNIKRYFIDIPSASGIEIIDGKIFVMGDNSPWIYQLDHNYNIINTIEVYPFQNLENGTITKKLKPDFEAATTIEWNNESALLMIGSGSLSPTRDIALVVFLNSQKPTLTFSLTYLYKTLKQTAQLKDEDLNIEAATTNDNDLLLFNRGKNIILKYNITDFKDHLINHSPPPSPVIYRFNLPQIKNIMAGFSGACTFNDEIFFTASVENTNDWINDGEVLGSFIGKINISSLSENNTPASIPIQENNTMLPIKVESIVHYKTEGNIQHFLMVTDSDGGNSELIEIFVKN